MKRLILIAIMALAIAAAGAAGYFYAKSTITQNNNPQSSQSNNQANNQQNNNGSQNKTTSDQQSVNMSVYFSKHPDSDDDPSKVFAVSRTSPDSGVGKYAIAQLLAGPTPTEQQAGYFATARLRNDTSTFGGDFTLTITDGVATLQFCKTFDHLGVVADGQAESEIKASLTQFSTVKKVIILNKSGDCEFNLSGLNLCLQ